MQKEPMNVINKHHHIHGKIFRNYLDPQQIKNDMVRIALLFFFVCSITSLHAQQAVQFEEIEQYPASVEAMFTTSKPTEDDKLLIARFSEAWQNGTLSENEKMKIVQLSGLFQVKKARNIHYLLLWRCILSFKDPLNTGKGYDTWMDALYKTTQERRTTPTSLQTIMNATELLLNKKIICSSPGSEWRTNGNDYRFEQTDDGLTVVFGTADIFCFSVGDSIQIGQTTGRFNMATQQWTGRGGNVTWERTGFEASEVYATLDQYKINMKQSRYEADSVMFVHKIYFPTPVKGKLSDKVMRNQSPETALYPEFQTHDKTFVFENIYPDVSFEGGILIQGARTIGSGTDTEKALIRIEKSDSLKLHVH
ncbi:MAG: hypothetical protein LBQ60_19585, partial [Bacteroidales bacterium]|nr:hypothetical protein [Bacteroidales bacterium]